jgi:TRAP-type C4-dicarboxylate transport system permease small subunit
MKMKAFQSIVRFIDRAVELITAYMMAAMVCLVTYQVFGRYVLHRIPSWTEEVALLFMMWFGFLSIALGFRHQLHIRITMFVDKLPVLGQRAAEWLSHLIVIGFGLLLIVEGYKFTLLTWHSTLPVTKLPTGMQYVIIPITGVLTMLYGLVWIIGGNRER